MTPSSSSSAAGDRPIRRGEDPRDVLTEGIRFDEWLRADPEQRITADELAALISEDRDS
jgi:hypothetical protein